MNTETSADNTTETATVSFETALARPGHAGVDARSQQASKPSSTRSPRQSPNPSRTSALRALAVAVIAALNVACSGGGGSSNDDIRNALEIDLDSVITTRTELHPGDDIDLIWRATSALPFTARLLLSHDPTLSDDDVLLFETHCDFDQGSTCAAGDDNVLSCTYGNDNNGGNDNGLDCAINDADTQENDITAFLTQVPINANLIIEVCNDVNCDSEAVNVNLL